MEKRIQGSLYILIPAGDQHVEWADEMVPEIQALAEQKTRHVALDLKQVRYTTSRTIGTLVKCIKTVKASGGEMYFFNVRDDLHRVFQQTGLSSVCSVFSTEKELAQEIAAQTPGASPVVSSGEAAMPFQVGVDYREPWAVLNLKGTLDRAEDQERLENCLQQVRAEGHRQVILNLQDLMFIDSAGVGQLRKGKSQIVHTDGGRFLLASPNEVVRDLFDLLGIFREMEVYETLEDALLK